MNKKNARDALDIYKRFLIRMDRVAEFLKVAEVEDSFLEIGICIIKSGCFCPIPALAIYRTQKFGIDKADIPDLARVSRACRH